MNKKFDFFEKLNLDSKILANDIYFVGGATRSIIQNNTLPMDIDICGDIDVESLSTLSLDNKQYIKQLHSLRFKHGDHDIDLTAFRKEEYKKGYFPSKVERVHTPLEDSERRDFTINAVYISKSGEIIDFHNGLNHLKEKQLVQISDNTLKVDGMRIYRMVRFSLTLGLKIESNTLESAIANSANIFQIKKERGLAEYVKFENFITNENVEMINKLRIFEHLELINNYK